MINAILPRIPYVNLYNAGWGAEVMPKLFDEAKSDTISYVTLNGAFIATRSVSFYTKYSSTLVQFGAFVWESLTCDPPLRPAPLLFVQNSPF